MNQRSIANSNRPRWTSFQVYGRHFRLINFILWVLNAAFDKQVRGMLFGLVRRGFAQSCRSDPLSSPAGMHGEPLAPQLLGHSIWGMNAGDSKLRYFLQCAWRGVHGGWSLGQRIRA